jgi:hypothetical protein
MMLNESTGGGTGDRMPAELVPNKRTNGSACQLAVMWLGRRVCWWRGVRSRCRSG